MKQWCRLALRTWVVVLLLVVNLQAQDSPFPEPSLLAGKSPGTIVIKGGRLYKNSADFGLVQVPENRSTQHTRLLQLPFIRHHARKDTSSEPIFILGGGPGKSNLWREMPEVFYAHSDVINVGYRGVDGEVKLKCPEIGRAMSRDNPLSHDALMEFRKTLRGSYDSLVKVGIDLDEYTMLEVVEDMEAVRRALGYEKINLFSTSYGTQVAYLYCLRYPSVVNRNLMVGASSRGHRFDSLWEPAVIEKMLREYNSLWKRDPEASANSPDILKTVKSVLDRLPMTWNDIPIDRDKVRLATFVSLYETESAAAVFDAFVAAEKGDPGGLALLVLGYDEAVQDTSRQYWGDFITKLVSGGMDSTRDYENEMDPPGSVLGSPSAKLWWTAASHGGWPVAQIPREYQRLDTINVRTLILNGQLDFSSPPDNMMEVKPYFTNGHVVVLPAMGHMDVFKLQRGAIDHLVERFYVDGVADTSWYRAHTIDFTPAETLQDEAKRLFGKE
ncbi:MAG: alpha/beta hydrolase [Bacteroidetes bacterium]|nr:alpha/beta hydrolase [Bacteroidota bacterium]